MTASVQANTHYAIPPRPDIAIAPAAFSRWQRAVAAPLAAGSANGPTPILTPTNVSNSPVRLQGPLIPFANSIANGPNTNGAFNAIYTGTSYNWSGNAIYNSLNPFKVEAIIGEFVVPTARQAYGTCTGDWVYSSQWPGIDGYGSGDVLQAGVEADAYCNGGTTASFYSAWIEWYPFPETRVSVPAVHPGDLVFIELWNTSATNGYAYIYNYSTRETATYQLTPPSGVSLQGNSVEWIVERPGVGDGLATLTNYINVSWPHGIAWDYAARSPTYYWQGGTPASGSLVVLTMLDNAGQRISSPIIENFNFLYFYNYGSSN
ncbi:G1 family glutamic endopeptidase [Beijerinckia indica]|nr:G1 family glutamic endopeptidase [Beijerinckia indica]